MQKQIPSIELKSEEVRDILSYQSHWLVRWGLTFFLLILLLILTASWLIHYPEIVKAPFRLTSVNAPRPLLAKVDGKIIRLFVNDRQWVQPGQFLAVLETTADYTQVFALSDQLMMLEKEVNNPDKDTLSSFLSFSRLGELQAAYQSFTQVYRQYLSFGKNRYYSQRIQLLEKELADLAGLEKTLNKQLRIHTQDFEIAKEEYGIQKELAEEKVIASIELKREQSKLLAKELPIEQTQALLFQCLSTQSNKRKELLELNQLIQEGQSSFVQSLSTLQSEVDSWKSRFMVVAPVAGMVSYATLLEEMQSVSPNQELFFISPKSKEYFGEVLIAQHNLGKIHPGQRVQIKFDSYPFQEYGFVEGQISYLSDIATKQNLFLAKVSLPKGLVTNEKKKLTYKTGMSATVEIITQDNRLLELLFHDLRKAVSR